MDDKTIAVLMVEAAAVDANAAPAVQSSDAVLEQQPAAPPGNESAEIETLITMTVSLFAPALPSIKKIYTPQVISQLAELAAPVMRKHGWTVSGLFGKWAEEIALAAVVIPLGIQTYHAVKADIAEAKKTEQEKKTEPSATHAT